MLKRVKVQGKLSKVFVISLSVVMILICGLVAYYCFRDDASSGYTKYLSCVPIAMLGVFIPLWFKNSQMDEYVSELLIDDDSLTLVYKNGKNEWFEKILLDNIKNVDVLLNANNVAVGRSLVLFCETIVTISTKDKKRIYFREVPTASVSFCNYAFMLRLLDVAKFLPNFKYKVEGNSEVAKLDVEHYATHGKRLPMLRRELIYFKRFPLITRIALFIILVLMISGIGLLVYMNLPSFTTGADKEYVSYIENGYNSYRNGLYERSLAEYDKALNIHDNDSTLYYYRALTYYRNKQYEKAIQEAQKGISVLNQKSAYHRAKKWIFVDDSIGLYTTLGDSEMQLKNYENAKKAYDYVADNVRYTYTDVYFKRGQCEFYLNDKKYALMDFLKHKQIIQQYLSDQAQSEYPAKYPTYTNESLKNIDLWINACK